MPFAWLKTMETLKPNGDLETARFLDYEVVDFFADCSCHLDLYMIVSPHSPNDIMPAICTG